MTKDINVNVDVSGDCGSGKTVIAHLIADLVEKSGDFKVVVKDSQLSDEKTTKNYNNFKENKDTFTFGGRTININIKHA